MGFTRRSIIQIDCKRSPEEICEQLRDAYLALENRIGEAINEEGVITGNLPQGVQVPGCNGELHNITHMASSQIQLENEGWGLRSNVEVFNSTETGGIFDPAAICLNPDGTLFIEIHDAPGASGSVRVWPASNYNCGATPSGIPTGEVTDAILDTASHRATFTDDGEFMLMMSTQGGSGRWVHSIDMTDPSNPTIADTLDVTFETISPWRDILWDEANRVLWFCDGSQADRLLGAQLDASGNMTLIAYQDLAHINRAECLDLSDNGNFIYVGSRGRIVVVDISNLGAISTDNTVFSPGGGFEPARYIAHSSTNMGFAGGFTTPATVYSVTIDASQNGLTFNNSIQLSTGDSLGSNQGYTLGGTLWGLISQPEASTYLMLVDITAPTPTEVEAININPVGNVGSRYNAPDHKVWSTYIRPAAQPDNETYVQKWAGGILWGNPADKDKCYEFNGWIAAYFHSVAPQGVPPLIVESTTLVVNLNADLLDGLHAQDIEDNAVSRAHDEWLFWERMNTP